MPTWLLRVSHRLLKSIYGAFFIDWIAHKSFRWAGQAVGLMKVSRDGRDWILIQIQLTQASRGQGVGRQLIQSVIDEARKAGASLSLGVLKANPAVRLYQRLGFTVVEEGIHSYEMRLEGDVLQP